ncbi:MAG TPA: prepilin-type N-terminal cleavage/methylation domain-containing protein [Methylobacter sp.]|jgi:prepilin-type N-terminal cleavage/methylation domain-containing protein
MKRTQYGFTAVELLIVISISAIFIVILAHIGFGLTASGDEAAAEAKQFANQLHIDNTGISCADRDTDGDGYVSCTIAAKDGRLIPILCAINISMNSGCKMQFIFPQVPVQKN